MDDLKTDTLRRLDSDERYKKLLSTVDDETRLKIDAIVRQFVSDLAVNLQKLTYDEAKQKLLEILKNDRR